jgi:hypothetical protein
MFTFKRGFYATRVYQLRFDIGDTFLTFTSDRGTVHGFKLENVDEVAEEVKTESWGGFFSRQVYGLASYVSESAKEQLASSKSHFRIRHSVTDYHILTHIRNT